MGTPQGCSSASLSYLVVEDIILSTFQSSLILIDPYLSRDPHGYLFPQTPTQFVDDTYIFSRSISGAQNAINLLQTAEPILNIRINPSKTRHFSITWSPPTSNKNPYYTLNTPSPTLHAFNTDNTLIPITPIPLSLPTRVLGAFIAPDSSNSHISVIRSPISRTKATIFRKRASLATIWAVLRQCIFPKFTYLLKFTNTSLYDLDTLSAPLRDLIRRKANASHLPNAILFSGNATPYSLPFTDLTSHVLKEKECTMIRMLSGSSISRRTIHCLLSRGHRLISDHISFSSSTIPCPLIPKPFDRALPHHHCWALSLIQYLQASNTNLSISVPFPLTLSHTSITQTPLHTLYHPILDSPLTTEDIFNFEASYHVHFLEELFPSSSSLPPTSLNSYPFSLPPIISSFPVSSALTHPIPNIL